MHLYTGVRPIVAVTIVAALSAACGGNGESGAGRAAVAATAGSSIAGDYGGDQCLYEKLTFTSNGVVYMTIFGTDQAGQYQLDGDRIVVTAGAQSAVFTKNGGNLEANVLGERMVCAPITADGLEVYEAATEEGRVTLELGAGGHARMTMMGFPGSDVPERVSFEVRYEARGNNVTVEIPGDEPVQFVRNGRDLVSTMSGEQVRFVRR